jgi:transcriptional regulator with PAS, ATPase and Fis domain
MSGTKDASDELPSLFLGSTEAAGAVRKQIVRAARVDSPVLVRGESGVGKELVAREIHARSRRSDGPFIPVNCAAIPDTLIESELFGHRAGAFTDARRSRRGAFEMADGGTLFLDEVGDLSRVAQPKLLRALESREVTPIGSESSLSVELRVIAATNHNLVAMRTDGSFRADLYFRLSVIEIHIPPLRVRKGDIPELVEHFAGTLAENSGRPFSHVGRAALEMLEEHSWPGNVRELKATIERALAMSSGMILDSTCFDLDLISSPGASLPGLLSGDWRSAKKDFETAYVRRLLKKHDGNVYKAARAANLSPRSLYKILRRLGLRPGP